jgi:hypothetical protein
MNRVHGLVDQRRSRSTMKRSRGAAVGSPELVLGAAPVSGSSPWVEEKGEELWGVLTVGESGRHIEGVRPAVGSNGGGGWSSSGMVFESRRMENEDGNRCEGWRGAHNAFYRAEEGVRWGVNGGGLAAGGKCDFNGRHFGKWSGSDTGEEPVGRLQCGSVGEAVGRKVSGSGQHAWHGGPRPAWWWQLQHDGRKRMTGPSRRSWAERPSGLGVLGRPISEKKRKENRNRLGWQGLLGQNQIGVPEENKNCFWFSDSREWDSNQKI